MKYEFFCSGANRVGEYVGLMKANINFGVSLKDIHHNQIDDLIHRAELDPKVSIFVDSGAFGEVSYDQNGIRSIVSPIEHDDWLFKLKVYDRLADSYGVRCVVVAPDCVGDQEQTLIRLRTYRDIVLGLMSKCRVIIPLQIGRMSLSEMYAEVNSIFGTDRYIVGIPCKKGATPLKDLNEFMVKSSPTAVHLLGVGPSSKKWLRIKQMIAFLKCKPKHLSMDSVRLRALVGREGYKEPRPLTERLDYYKSKGLSPRDAKIASIQDLQGLILKEVSLDEQDLLPWGLWLG